jgi:hypothetical protein
VKPLTRAQLRGEQARLLSRAGDVSSWRRISTSGTTGEPVEVVLDEAARGAEVALFGAHVDEVLGGRAWRAGDLFHLALHQGAASRSMASSWGPGRSVKWNLLRAWQSSADVFAECLTRVNKSIVTMLPSVALLICQRLRRNRHAQKVRPLLVALSGESIEPAARAIAEETLGCPVTSFYSLAEAGIVGLDCGPGCYRADPSRMVVEILNDDGAPVTGGAEGEIVVTPLDNLAMPLLRYRTGDRGMWVDACGRDVLGTGCFALSGARRPKTLLTDAGASVNVVRFAKVLAALPLERFHLDQLPEGGVVFRYSAASALDDLSCSLAVGVLRAAMGPDCAVVFQRELMSQRAEASATGGAEAVGPGAGPRELAEPEGPGIDEVARWLGRRLSPEPGIEVAALIGSALDPEWSSRFSDIDVVALVQDDPGEPRWLSVYRSLRRSLPRLSINFDRAAGLDRRAPLVACRLLAEGRSLVGETTEGIVRWPTAEALRCYGIFWTQGATAALWHRLAAVGESPRDPVREGWLASRYCLDALRLRFLSQGDRRTSAREVVAAALADPNLRVPWFEGFREALDISREHQPPLPPEPALSQRFLQAALSCVRYVAENLAAGSHERSGGSGR